VEIIFQAQAKHESFLSASFITVAQQSLDDLLP